MTRNVKDRIKQLQFKEQLLKYDYENAYPVRNYELM